MNNKVYDRLKQVALIVLPALATLVAALGLIWHVPYTDPIVATIVAVDTFLGAVLGVSTYQYNKAK